MEIYKNIFSDDFCDTLIKKIKNECVLSQSYKTNWFVWLIWGQLSNYPLDRKNWNRRINHLPLHYNFAAPAGES